jgi:hypothetical protein
MQTSQCETAQHCIIDHLTKLITDDAAAQHRHKISDVTHQPTELIGGMQETMESRSSAKDMQAQLHRKVQGTCLILAMI